MSKLSVKASSRIALNTRLLAIAIGIFFLTINLRAELLFQNILVIQLVMSIPLFLTSTLSYSKIGYRSKVERWDTLGWVTFIFGYAFILNVIGILIGKTISLEISIIFFIFSWILTLIYSSVEISYNRSAIKERLTKDTLFIIIQFILGLMVVLGFF